MKKFTHRQISSPAGLFFALLLASSLAVSARVLDNFSDNLKTGWTDSLGGGSVSESGGQFNITTSVSSGAVTSSKKTSEAFTILVGQTLELRVDVGTVSPAYSPNVLAVLAWVPTGNALFANGYSLTAGANDVKLQKGATVLWTASLPSGIQNSNVTLVLRMTPSGSAMTVNARVYKQTGTAALQNFTVLAEYTATDASGLIGTAGNATLGVINPGSPTGASVKFDNLQVFELANGVLDNFNVADNLAGWAIAKKNSADAVVEGGGQVTCRAYLASGGGFATAYNTAKTFKIVDGSRLEFSIRLVGENTLDNTYFVFGYLPGPGSGNINIYSLLLYHIGYRVTGGAGGTALVNGKNYNGWWGAMTDGTQPGTPNRRMWIAMTGEGTSCRIESRVENLNVDVNDPARIEYQNVFVDTAAKDLGTEPYILPYMNLDGNFTFGTFNDGAFPPAYAEVIFDDAEYAETVPENAAPTLLNISPPHGSNFVSSASAVSFNAVDDTNTPMDNIILTLNGVRYTNGSPGVTITGGNQNRLFTLTGALSPNVNYIGSIKASDNVGATIETGYQFDTFLTNDFLVESEEYNFGSGQFLDNPLLIPEGWSDPNAYNDQSGTAEIDFHDNQTGAGGGPAVHTFRTFDPVRTAHAGDPARAKYILAGGGDAGYFEQMVDDIHDNDWLNYTKTYPSGNYLVYLRQSQYIIPASLVTLERVTSDRTQPSQTTAVMGSFLGTVSGLDRYLNVPLTDGAGNPVVVHFSGGVQTLRVRDWITGNADDNIGVLLQNYLVFVPTANPGTLRPYVAMALPPANWVVDYSSPAMTNSASIANRDTTVSTVPGDIILLLNGAPVAATVTPTGGGADVTWPLSALPPTQTITNTLIFKDSASVWQTNTWAYSYAAFLRASNGFPLGSLTVRGISARMVQTNSPTWDNSLARAEQQLAIPPQIPYEVTYSNIIQTINWNDAAGSGVDPVPGLDQDGTHDNIAVEMFAYLELTAGAHRFQAVSDDRFQLRSGTTLADTGATVMGQAIGNTFSGTFDFMVEATGLYPVRCIWEENGGGANFSLRSVNPDTTTPLINDPGNPVGVVKAYFTEYPVRCLAASTVSGPYAADGTAAFSGVTLTGGTVMIPMAGGTKFYRLQGPKATKILSAVRSGSNLVLTYQIQ
jgi:hypothetical protein